LQAILRFLLTLKILASPQHPAASLLNLINR
jgi:hypothetical protein